eukprot:gene13567-biopygen11079
MGPEVGPAFQRRSRDTVPFLPGVRLADSESRHRVLVTGKKEPPRDGSAGTPPHTGKMKGWHNLTTGSLRPARHHGGHVKGIGTPAGLPYPGEIALG